MRVDLDLQIAQLAARQHGAFTRRQAIGLGFSLTSVRIRVANGKWTSAGRRTLVVNGTPDTWDLRASVALLECGPGAALSHATAAAFWGLGPRRPTVIDVSVPHRNRRTADDRWNIHRARTLGPRDAKVVHGLTVTRPERTLADLAGTLERRALERVVDSALGLGLVSMGSMRRYIRERSQKNRKGVGKLLAILDDREIGIPGSELERQFIPLIKKGRLPVPTRQHRVGARKIDFGYPDLKIGIELDGRGPHSSRAVFEDDRRRQNALVLDGWLILRFTWNQVTKRADFVVATIRRAIEARSQERA